MSIQNRYREICANCNCTFGSHLANSVFDQKGILKYSRNTCPGHEGEMDWENGSGTIFEPSGKYKE
jgi:hypothetical protein